MPSASRARRASTPRWITALMAVLFAGATIEQTLAARTWWRPDWGMTEWLINYAGGFVRRGLPGTIIYHLAASTGLPANEIAVGISLVAFVLLTGLFLTWGRGRLPAYLILSPVVLAAPAYSAYIVRKDVLEIVLLIACLLVSRRRWPVVLKVAAINAIAVAAVLSHESFFFAGFAALVLASAAPPRGRVSADLRTLAAAAAKLLPIVAAFVLTAVFHGNADVAQAVNNSWAGLWGRIGPVPCCYPEPSAAIGGLQWSAAEALSYSASTLGAFSHGVYVPFAWLMTILACAWFMVGCQQEPSPAQRRLAATLMVQLVAIAPLFAVGGDFGRWIFLWTASSLAIYLFDVNIDRAALRWLTTTPAAGIERLAAGWAPRPWYLLGFGIPGCCWDVLHFLLATPPGHVFVMLQSHLQ